MPCRASSGPSSRTPSGTARRMLGDLGHDIDSSVFTISDISYQKDFISRYGLLKTSPDNSIIKVKMAYYAVQNVVSIFNDSIQRAPGATVRIASEQELTWYAFKDKKTGLNLVTLWDGTAVPGNDCRIRKAGVTIQQGRFQEPVWVDLLTGGIYAIPAESMSVNGTTYTFHAIPIYDAPVVITDKSLLKFVPAKKAQAATLGG